MTKFEKLIIPFLSKSITPELLSKNVGFIDSFVMDNDAGVVYPRIYLAYDYNLLNEDTIHMNRILFACDKMRGHFIRRKDGITYSIFWIDPPKKFLKSFENGQIYYDIFDKYTYTKFWGLQDKDLREVLSSDIIYCNQSDLQHAIPLKEYEPTQEELASRRLTLTK